MRGNHEGHKDTEATEKQPRISRLNTDSIVHPNLVAFATHPIRAHP